MTSQTKIRYLRLPTLWGHHFDLGILSSPFYNIVSVIADILRPLLLVTRPLEPITCRPREFVDLPTELLVEVLCCLEWDDVQRTRQVCKRLHETSYDRTVWHRLFTRYSDAMEPRLFRLEKPLRLYSSHELETMICRWKSIDQRWSRDGVPPTLERKFVIEGKARGCSHLVRGGRWFLQGTSRGELKYVDLEAADLTPRILLPSPFTENIGSDEPIDVDMRISVDLNFESPFLEFNLAIILARYDVSSAEHLRIQIWRVRAECDPSVHVGALTAQMLSSFSEEGHCNPRHISLLKNHVAYVIHHVHPKPRKRTAVIVNWVEADGGGLEYCRRVVRCPTIDWLCLIPEDRIVCGKDPMKLYHFKDIPLSQSIPSSPTIPSASSVASADLFFRGISDAFSVDESVRFLCTNNDGISGLLVHNGLPSKMEVVPMYKNHMLDYVAHLGYTHGMAVRNNDVAFFGTSWPGEENDYHYVSPKLSPPQFRRRVPLSFVDEVSGRAILADLHGDEYILLHV